MTEQLRDEVARQLCASEGFDWNAASVSHTPNGETQEEMREHYYAIADAAIAIVLERAADAIKADKDWGDYDFGPGFDQAVKIIEALQEQNGGGDETRRLSAALAR